VIPAIGVVPSGYSWSKLPQSRIHEVRFHGELVGTVQRPSVWKSAYEAETTAGKWIFRRKGLLGTAAEIMDATRSEPIASYKAAWAKGGILKFSDGQTFRLHCKGLWHPTWTVQSLSGTDVLFLHTREKTAEVSPSEILEQARRNLLVMFVLYRVLQAEDDAASAAMVAS